MKASDGSVELVHAQTAGAVATITLDSPANRNALSRRLVAELTERLREADTSDQVRVVVLTHTGTTFCAGADLSEAVQGGMAEGSRALLALLRLVVELATPVVAVVDGHARAGGVGLLGACDLAVVSRTSTFGFTEVRLGLAPAVISLTTSGRLTESDAAAKYLTGSTFDGDEAARSGLVSLAVASEDLADTTAAIVDDLLLASPQGLLETKRLLNGPRLARMDRDGDTLVALSARLFGSTEAREAMAAFRERRPPPWATS
jgi:enoyl-CoA hydratase